MLGNNLVSISNLTYQLWMNVSNLSLFGRNVSRRPLVAPQMGPPRMCPSVVSTLEKCRLEMCPFETRESKLCLLGMCPSAKCERTKLCFSFANGSLFERKFFLFGNSLELKTTSTWWIVFPVSLMPVGKCILSIKTDERKKCKNFSRQLLVSFEPH